MNTIEPEATLGDIARFMERPHQSIMQVMNKAIEKERDMFTEQVVKGTEEAGKWDDFQMRVANVISDHEKDKVSTESDMKVIVLMPYKRNRTLSPETTP